MYTFTKFTLYTWKWVVSDHPSPVSDIPNSMMFDDCLNIVG